MKKFKTCLILFLTMFKIGLFTFGGGYAMISIIEREFVEKKKWLKKDEFLDIIAISESTPGPLAINSSTFIGYNRAGILGSIFATLGVVMPSFIIIFAISFVFDRFLSLRYVQYAFRGIQACVIFLILSAGIKLLIGLKKNFLNMALFSVTTVLMVVFSLFAVSFSSIFFILIGGFLTLLIYLIVYISNKNRKKKGLVPIKSDFITEKEEVKEKTLEVSETETNPEEEKGDDNA